MDPLPGHSQALLRWYAAGHRDLPWRRTRDPYAIWVSEIMLQQTQVTTVIPYYERFPGALPDRRRPGRRAPLDEVLALWQGLGYYARARSLHARRAPRLRASTTAISRATARRLRALPGIGDYTAGAILSIAFGLDEVAIDGNVVRVLCRLFDVAADPSAWRHQGALARATPKGSCRRGEAGDYQPGDDGTGRHDLPAQSSACLLCPLAPCCQARALGVQEQRPVPRVPPPGPPSRLCRRCSAARDGRLLLVTAPAQRPAGRAMGVSAGRGAAGYRTQPSALAHSIGG